MTHELSTIKYMSDAPAIAEPERRCSTQWTKGIWITCLVCCVAGCYGIVHGSKKVYEHATSAKQKVAAKTLTGKRKKPDVVRFEKAVKKFEKQNQQLLVAHRVFEAGTGLALLFGGALMMWRSPHARKVVFAACLAMIIFHLSTAVLKVYQFVSLKETFESMSSQALRRAGVGGADHKRYLQHGLGSMGFGHSLGVLFVLGLQSLFFGRLMYFVAQPHVREVFAEDPYPEFRELEEQAAALDAITYAQTVRKQVQPQDEPKKAKTDANKFAKV